METIVARKVSFSCISIYPPLLEMVPGLSGGYVNHDAVVP